MESLSSARSSVHATARAAILITALMLSFGAPRHSVAQAVCQEGFADIYPCENVDLLAFLSPGALGGGIGVSVNDLWGWTDPTTGKEYALVGRQDGTAFVDVSDPIAPVYLGNLPTNTVASVWRDIKVYDNHAFIVADRAGSHGMQVFDLAELRGIQKAQTFEAVAVYDSIASAHNIVINESSGFAYAVGVNSGGLSCGGGLHMIDLSVPAEPAFAGCFAHVGTGRRGTGYTHDAQCVVYTGPDEDYQGREICFASNETAISIADVSNKSAVEIIVSETYPTAQYVHQGWLSDDQKYFYQDDELDESRGTVSSTSTIIWDVTDLDDPQVVKMHDHGTPNIDHNMYVRGNRLFQAHYLNGLRVSDISNPEVITEIAYFDTMPNASGLGGGIVSPYDGAWSVYPFFASGTVLVSSSNGLFVLRPVGAASVSVDDDTTLPSAEPFVAVTPNPVYEQATVTIRVPKAATVAVTVYDVLGREVRPLSRTNVTPDQAFELILDTDGMAAGTYFVVARGDDVEVSRKFVVVK